MQAELHAAVDAAFEAEQVPWLGRLVDQPSHTYAREDVEAAASIVDEAAAALGLVRERAADPSGVFADHRIYSTPAAGEGARWRSLDTSTRCSRARWGSSSSLAMWRSRRSRAVQGCWT